MKKDKKSIIRLLSLNEDLIVKLNRNCNVTNLIHMLKINVLRVYFQSFLVFFIVHSTSVAILSKYSLENFNYNIIDEKEKSIYVLLALLLMIFLVCTIFCAAYVIYICNKISECIPEKDHTLFEYEKFQNRMMNELKNWAVFGCANYFVVSFIGGFIFAKAYEASVCSVFVFSIVGLISSLVWNYSCYLTDRCIDWSYIVKGFEPLFEKNRNILKNESELLEKLRKDKFRMFKKQTVYLAVVSFIVVFFACITFYLGADNFDVDIYIYISTLI